MVGTPRVGAGKIEGPRGGEVKAIRGPRGRGAVKIEGPRGGEIGAVRGRHGRGAVAARGPRGYGGVAVGRRGVGGVWGVKGPRGRAVVGTLPGTYKRLDYHGHRYYHHGHYWYRPYLYGGVVRYWPAYPPVGYYYSTLPVGYTTVVIDNRSYYTADGAYYTEGEKDGESGYVVVEAPEVVAEPEVVPSDDAAAPDPFETLRAMSDYLGKLKEFTFAANVTSDQVQEFGEKIQVSSRRTVSVRRPDKIVVEIRADGDDRHVSYDGKTVNVYSRTHEYYGTEKMPDSIDEMLEVLSRDFGMKIPLGDLIYTDVYKALVPLTRTGQYIGQHVVDERQCHHLLFTQDAIDWQIWIEVGDKPLPRKIVITNKLQPGKPVYTATLPLWELKPKFSAGFFDFKPPPGAEKIQLLPVPVDDVNEQAETTPATQKTK